ncbi:helix-turn-helix transcriptional regulator [Azospirillum sp. Sh1]|uniref:AraC family transcriptional regulator n=1 Tax=Azospirillum sp. Sh1 TaxID=2607285 RepID=UPI0011EEF7AC|nr:helix-turn-helix transcriptional regulator [Azospirillum sp. Sh1]KAA0576284.1 helix-turn-helix transcriptional regulator [Azospirillum sp. Sh1]
MPKFAQIGGKWPAVSATGEAVSRVWDLTGLRVSFTALDPDDFARPLVSFLVQRNVDDDELPIHQHRKGQLVVAAEGSVMCRTLDGLRIVPSNGAVWIPGEIPHSVSMSDKGRSYCVFINPEISPLPNSCATFSISPMLREMIFHLANLPPLYPLEGPTSRLVQVILDELAQMKAEPLHFPVSNHPKIQRIAAQLLEAPDDRRTIREWAAAVATSERTLARLIQKHTGMPFGRWRQQLHIVIAVQRLSMGATVQAISQELGYDSPSAFTAMFRKHMGQPPRRYLQDRAEVTTN